VAVDELASGREDVRVRSGLALASLLLAALAAAGWGLARWESARQYDALLEAAVDAEQVVRDSRRSLGGLVQYSGGLLARTDLAPAQRQAVLASFAVDARRFPPRVQGARAQAAAVRPLPWDGELAVARDAYLARLDAWTGFVAAAQDQPDTLLLERRATRQAREDAARALAAAADGRSSDELDLVRAALLGR
jgi:hypothetical protein